MPELGESAAERPKLGALAHQDGALHQFARWALEVVFEGCDIDGGEAQDKAVELGLLREVEGGYDPEVHGESELAEPGDPWYVLAGPLGPEEEK